MKTVMFVFTAIGVMNTIADDWTDGNDGLPFFSINTNGVDIPDEPKVLGEFFLDDRAGNMSSGKIGIELRGSSSLLFFPKKSYSFETRNAEGMDVDVSLLGLPSEEDWILHGPYADKSLVRNVLTYDLARDMGRYASRTRFLDLEINGAYKGIYVLMEKLKRDKNRIDITKPGNDVTGGYILKIDRSKAGDGNFTNQDSFVSLFGSDLNETSSTNVHYLYDDPASDEINKYQKEYISRYVGEFETALAANNFINPLTGVHYAEYIGVNSFIDFMILNEISNNVDAYRLSTYMNKDAGNKLEMGPIWDFNMGFGNTDACNAGFTHGWGYKFNKYCEDKYPVSFWWGRLLQDPWFVGKFQNRWSKFRENVLSEKSIFSRIDAYVETISGSVDKNSETWSDESVHSHEICFLKYWISDRLTWMDGAIENGEM